MAASGKRGYSGCLAAILVIVGAICLASVVTNLTHRAGEDRPAVGTTAGDVTTPGAGEVQPTAPPAVPAQPPAQPLAQPPSQPAWQPPAQPPTQPPAQPPAQPPVQPPAQPPATPPPAPALYVDLAEAESQGLVQVTVRGNGLEHISVSLTSQSQQALRVAILPGLIFEAGASGVQNMVVIGHTVVLLSEGETDDVNVPVACSNMNLDMPSEENGFTIRREATNPDLLKLLNLPAFENQDFRVQQFAIWTISDNPARDDYVGLGYYGVGSGPDDEEMQLIRTMFEQAGIDTGQYRALQ